MSSHSVDFTDINLVRVVIKFNESSDLDLGQFDASKYTAADIKLRIRAAKSEIKNPLQYDMRLICRGSLVPNNTRLEDLLLPDTLVNDGKRSTSSLLGTSLSKRKGKEKVSLDGDSSSSNFDLRDQTPYTLYFHCAVNERPAEKKQSFLHPNDSWVLANNSNDQQQQNQTHLRNGFDRLLDIGFSSDDVSALRQQFHAIRGSSQTAGQEAITAEDYWMDNGANHLPNRMFENAAQSDNESDTSSSADEGEPLAAAALDPESGMTGGKYHMLLGVMAGFFFNVLTLICLLESNLFTRKAQLGIATGCLVNLIWGAVRLLF